MAQKKIGLGNTANDNKGDSLRVGGGKINDNFTELYNTKYALEAEVSLKTNSGGYTGTSQDLKDEIDGASFTGLTTYQTLSELEAVSPVPDDGTPAKVANDPDPSNNGYYSVVSGVWVQDEGIFLTMVDNDDIVGDGNSLLIADRASDINGKKGYKIIRPSFDFTNIPGSYANSIWEIRYAFDLQGETFTLPPGVTLKFAGGMFKNGGVEGNQTIIKTDESQIFEDVIFLGSFGNKFFSPIWCGAKGDGVTDDTAAFKDILHSSIKLNIEIKEGVYLISEQLNIKSNTILKGQDSKLKIGTSAIKLLNLAIKESVLIEGIEFEGVNTVEIAEQLIYAGGSTNISIKNCIFRNSVLAVHAGDGTKNVKIEGCEFYDIIGTPGVSEGYGVLLNGDSEGAVIQNNHFERVQRHCVYLSGGSTNCLISNNVMVNLYGSAININGGASFFVNPIQNCVISNNVITNVSDNGSSIARGIGASGVFINCIIKGNAIRDTEGEGIYMSVDGVPKDNLICDNALYNVAYGSSEDAVVLVGERNVFSNNIIYSDNVNLNRGIYIINSLDCIISGGQTFFNNRFSVSADSPSNTGLTIVGVVEQNGAGFSYAAAIDTKGFFYRGNTKTEIA